MLAVNSESLTETQRAQRKNCSVLPNGHQMGLVWFSKSPYQTTHTPFTYDIINGDNLLSCVL